MRQHVHGQLRSMDWNMAVAHRQRRPKPTAVVMADSGPGIPDGDLPDIFRALLSDDSRRPARQSTGIGHSCLGSRVKGCSTAIA